MQVKFIKKMKTNKERTILAIAKEMDIKIKAPCKGKGKCGKCLVKVVNGQVSELSKAEGKLLSKAKIEEGYRLACEAQIQEDVEMK